MFARAKGIKRSGDMIESIGYKVGSGGSTVVIGPSAEATAWQKTPWDNTSARAMKLSQKQKDAKWQFFKGWFAEMGTAPHSTESGRTWKNLWGAASRKGIRGGQHPGTEARPFMEPAWEQNKAGVKVSVTKVINGSLKLVANQDI
jgi:hypothetical protein